MTLFDNVSNEILTTYRSYGFDWEDPKYINIFRWIWNELHYHPRIDSFPGDETNKTFVVLERPVIHKNPYKFTANSYDEAIIQIVDYIAENHIDYLKH